MKFVTNAHPSTAGRSHTPERRTSEAAGPALSPERAAYRSLGIEEEIDRLDREGGAPTLATLSPDALDEFKD